MSLNKKLIRVFQMGFGEGVKCTDKNWNGDLYWNSNSMEDEEKWIRKYESELELSLKEFIELLDSDRKVW